MRRRHGQRRQELPSDNRADVKGEIAQAYHKLVVDRQPFLDRAIDCSRLTIPSLIPPSSAFADGAVTSRQVNTGRLYTPYQSLGARGVNHLAAKLLLALFPNNVPFFRHLPDSTELEQALQDETTKGQIEEGMSELERRLFSAFERSNLRVPLYEALQHALVGGNVTIYIDPETNKGRLYPLSRFVCRRDPSGNMTEWIGVEAIDEDLLPQEVRDELEMREAAGEEPSKVKAEGDDANDDLIVYTRVWFSSEDDKWHSSQEVKGISVGEEGTYAKDACPWIVLRLIRIEGEDYGRSLIEEYYGDLQSLEKLTKAMVQFALAASKIIFFNKPNSATNIKQLAKAQSGEFVKGSKEDVEVLQLEKQADFTVTKAVADGITQRLSFAFLLMSAVQRQAERVTAEEMRLMAEELDTGLGGIYALLAHELQLPIVMVIRSNEQEQKRLPKIPHLDNMLRASIVTGVEAIGRGNDLKNLLGALQIVAQFPVILQQLNPEEIAKRVFAASNVDPKGLFKSPEQMQAEQAQATLAPAAQEAVRGYAQAAGKAIGAPQQAAPTAQQQ